MRRRLAVVAERIARAIRGLWPDRNPLRRTLDRVEGVAVAGLAVAFLAGAPLAAAAAWHAAYSYAARSAHVQQAVRHQVPAVPVTSVLPLGQGYQAAVQIRWRPLGGAWRTGVVPTPPAASAGKVIVGVDRAGQLSGLPLQSQQIRGQAALAAILAPVLLGLILLCTGQLAHYLLERRRLAAWDAAWRATGPRWARRR